jgi:hypothetical protein
LDTLVSSYTGVTSVSRSSASFAALVSEPLTSFARLLGVVIMAKKNMPPVLGRNGLQGRDTWCNRHATRRTGSLPHGGEAPMPEDHGESAGFDERSGRDQPDEFDDLDDFDVLDEFDEDEAGGMGRAWPGSGYPPTGYPIAGGARRGPGGQARRGLLFALTAVVAAAMGFGFAALALGDVSGSPAASSTPNAAPSGSGSGSEPSSGAGGGTQLAPQGGGIPPLPAGATEHLEVGGPVTAVSATSITLSGGGQVITAAVTRATKITGKVTSVGGIKVGDLVSASISGTGGKLTADSIQDPASLPSGPGQ